MSKKRFIDNFDAILILLLTGMMTVITFHLIPADWVLAFFLYTFIY